MGSALQITRELRGGGMARLFVAHDLLLQREVVVKILPPEVMVGASAERFRQEMQHAARLQHPHIVPVLSAGLLELPESTQIPYYVMPLVQGETLRSRIEREGALDPAEVRAILQDVVTAVAYAHGQGITHRDLKPDNIFLVGSSALVSDFGISEALSPDGRPGTGLGALLGTPGYAAPEQSGGWPSVDPRSDLYAIGVTAYEALTGQRPFEGDSIHALLVAQASHSPRPLEELRPGIPASLAALVMRCLEKRPEDRFRSAAELEAALATLVPTASAGDDKPLHPHRSWLLRGSLVTAVLLAFAFLTTNWHHLFPGENTRIDLASVALIAPEYFGSDSSYNPAVAQVVDRVSTTLSRVEGLKVVNYMSAGALYRRSQTPTFAEMGQALGVRNVAVFTPIGPISKGRFAVQLLEVSNQAQVWVSQYAADSANLETIETDLVSKITHALLGPSARLPAEAHSARARQEGAHAEYLMGMLALRRRTPDGVSEAIGHFEQALRLDSMHVEAVGRLATALGLQLSYGYRTTLGNYPTAARALLLAERAVTLDPAHGEPVGFLAYLEYLTLAPLDKVRSDFNRAMKMRASEADVAGWNGLMLLREGKVEQSLAESRRALDLDPWSSVRHLTLALAALGAHRYELAGLEARRASELELELRRPRQVEALALLLQNRPAECARMDLWPHLGVKAMCLRAAGQETESRKLVDSLLRQIPSEGDPADPYGDVVSAQELATYYAWRGDSELCLRYLRLAFERSPAGIDLRIVQSGIYDRVKEAPGFPAELLRILEAVWPRVQNYQKLLRSTEGMSPVF